MLVRVVILLFGWCGVEQGAHRRRGLVGGVLLFEFVVLTVLTGFLRYGLLLNRPWVLVPLIV